uniref:autotransporter outer membrane beta-barrel domain-containing protein n=1 Tax=Stenotrophomonas sp. TaxID=69392 RepID=UPI0028A235EF
NCATASVAGGTVSFGYGVDAFGVGVVEGAGSLLSARQMLVGREGSGVLTIGNGGRVETTRVATPAAGEFGLSIGSEAGSIGLVNIVAGGQLAVTDNYLLVGQAGNGTLNIDSGSVDAGRGLRTGTASGGDGTVRVLNGGQLTTQDLDIGYAQGGSGSIQVTGTGSTVNAATMRVSGSGDGALRIENGGVVAVTGNVTAEDNVGLPSNAARVGRIEVSGAGSLLSGDRVMTSTHLLVDDGGEIRSNSGRIKDSYSDTGVATLTGAGSRWNNQGELDARTNVDVLDGAVIATDTMLVSGGANTMLNAPRRYDQQIRVSGAGAAIEATNGITVGAHLVGEPYGVLGVSNGGRVAAGTTLTLGTLGYVVIGGGMQTWSVADGGPLWRAAEAAGELQGTIAMQGGSGGLVFNNTDDVTLSNTIVSDNSYTGGALTQVAGNTTLNGDLTGFGGGIKVTGGALQIESDMYTGQGYVGSSQASQQQIDVSGGTLVLNGSAGFQQQIDYGSSTETVRSSAVTVSGQGILAGNATVGETYVYNGGALSPGHNGIGAMTIDGDLYLSANGAPGGALSGPSYFDVDVLGNGQSDRLTVTGKAYLGRGSNLINTADASVRITGLDPAVSYQNGQTYTILDAAEGVQGTFDEVVSKSAFLAPTLAYTGNQVQLTIAVKDAGGTPVDPVNPVDPVTPVDPGNPGTPGNGGTPPIVFGAVAATGNQRATAAALDSLQQSGQALALYNGLLMLDEAGARDAFDDLSGEIHASSRALLLEDRFLREGIAQRLRPDPSMAASGPSAWVAGAGTATRQDSDGSAARTRQHREGLMAGVDWTVGGAWTVGLAAGSESLRQQIDDRHASTGADAVHGGLYAGFRGEELWINGGASYADYDLDTRRVVGTGWAQALNSSYNAHAVSVFAEGGWDMELDALTLSPYVAVAYTRLSTQAGVETGGSAALAIDASKDEVWTTTAGIRASWDISGGHTDAARLEAGLVWQNANGELRADSRHRFVAGSDAFTVSGLPLARNVGIAELGVSVHVTDNSRLSLFAQGRAGDGQRELGAQLNWNVSF